MCNAAFKRNLYNLSFLKAIIRLSLTSPIQTFSPYKAMMLEDFEY